MERLNWTEEKSSRSKQVQQAKRICWTTLMHRLMAA
jgi:hypothetical protein